MRLVEVGDAVVEVVPVLVLVEDLIDGRQGGTVAAGEGEAAGDVDLCLLGSVLVEYFALDEFLSIFLIFLLAPSEHRQLYPMFMFDFLSPLLNRFPNAGYNGLMLFPDISIFWILPAKAAFWIVLVFLEIFIYDLFHVVVFLCFVEVDALLSGYVYRMGCFVVVLRRIVFVFGGFVAERHV
jgi:hypothetical protein